MLSKKFNLFKDVKQDKYKLQILTRHFFMGLFIMTGFDLRGLSFTMPGLVVRIMFMDLVNNILEDGERLICAPVAATGKSISEFDNLLLPHPQAEIKL
ncbi:hypothetical protein VNO80_23467 [Phaseolus coccineus]|uniref:Uncharacterized protein n=1 Tax=Phaseolus coccineus TaxID=3886 RepID=A0AAN9MCF6_PHACN